MLSNGDIPFTNSGEDYNVVMQIADIRIHPDYEIRKVNDRTQYVIHDIAAIIVNDVGQDIFEKNKIYPACLPLGMFTSYLTT